MPTLDEQIKAATSKLDALLTAPAETPAETVQQMSAADAMLLIADELKKDGVTPERAAYLKNVVSEISKNFESNGEGAISIKVINDPLQLKPGTAPIAPLASLASASPETQFASQMTKAEKVAYIAKLLTNKDELKSRIAKSALTDKMDAIKSMFGLSETDLEDTYDVRWKIGDLIGILQSAIKLEQFVGSGSKTSKTDEPAAAPAPTATEKAAAKTAPAVWPRDMAAAKFDPVKKAYEPEPNVWADAK